MADKTYWASTSSGRIELEMTLRDAESVSHSGRCDEDVAELRKQPDIIRQTDKIDPATLRDELREYGAWEDDELQDHETNLDRIVWLLGGDIVEEIRSGPRGE